ncbi:MAG: NAD(P)H-dependent glycerol-3-phosphate dehydrogenase [Elusimicrobiota bacterium]|nr:NAD(P)H-dependent glycerol-3-phosphate dehydrogenase [Elusimicrobiota bacterium]
MNIAILGAGAWGLTLSVLLAKKNYSVKVWEFSPERTAMLNKTKVAKIFTTEKFLLKIPKEVKISSEFDEVLSGCGGKENIIVFCVPSHFILDTVKKLKEWKIANKKFTNTIFLSAIKGLQIDDLRRPTEVITDFFPEISTNICVLSGPSFAIEVAKQHPTAVVVASKSSVSAKKVQEVFMTEYFRVYTHHDIVGVELGGALKNIFAIACGISDGLHFGDNAKAGLITRGMNELVRLGSKLGGNGQTFFGLSGLGDLIATCFSKHSRNRAFGEKIGLGKKPEEALKEIKSVVEGYRTTKSAYLLGKKFSLYLPIIQEVYSVIYEGLDPKTAVKNLMLRSAKSEFDHTLFTEERK